MKDEKWIMFKNYMHNELGITKEDIKQWVDDAIKETAEQYIKHNMAPKPIDDWVKKTISDVWGISSPLRMKEKVLEIAGKEIGKTVIENMSK